MKIYDKYKESGVEWIGKVPEGWEVKKLKYVAGIVLGKMLTSDDKGEYFLKPYLRAQNIKWLDVDVSDVKEMWFSKNELESYLIKENELLISEGGEVGRTCIWKNELEECYIQNSVLKVAIKKGEPFFYLFQFYTLGVKDIFNSIVNKVSIGHLTKDKIKEIEFAIAPLTEQTAIANYLDAKTTEIDQTIADKEALIVLFEEEKKALINEAVTKGLNPNVKFKPSGIDWLGNIPEHWEVKRISTLAECITGFAFKSELFSFEDGIKLVRGDNVTEGFLRWGDKTRYWESITDDLEFCELSKDDIVIGMDGSKVGKNFAFVEKKDLPLLLVQRVARLRASSKLIAEYLYYNIYSSYFLLYIDLIKTDPAIPHITLKDIKDYKIMMPPFHELEGIISYMKVSLKDINEKISLIKKEIELLKEYKQVLIFEAVTGKIKVTD